MQMGRAVPSSCTSSCLGLGFSCCWRNHTTGMMAFMLDVGYRIRYPLSSSLKYILVLSLTAFMLDKPWFNPFLPARAVSLNKTLPPFLLQAPLSWFQAHHSALPGPGSTDAEPTGSPGSLPCPRTGSILIPVVSSSRGPSSALTDVTFSQITEPSLCPSFLEGEILVTQVPASPCPAGRCCCLWAACPRHVPQGEESLVSAFLSGFEL